MKLWYHLSLGCLDPQDINCYRQRDTPCYFRSSVSILSKELYDLLNLKKMEKFSIDILLADDSTKKALGRVNNVMVELHMRYVPVDFIVMDMGSNTSSPIILGRPFLRTTWAIIDSKEGNVKFQFPHKKCMENFPRKKEVAPRFKLPHDLHTTWTK